MGRFTNENIPVGRDNADNITATTNVVANVDGSVLERLEHIQNMAAAGSAGTEWYVDSDGGSDSNTGRSWSQAYLKIQTAVTACGDYDTIYVKGYTAFSEAIATTPGITGVNLIGVGNDQHRRPMWSSGATSSPMLTLNSRDWTIKGFFFVSSSNTVANIVVDEGGSNNGSGFVIEDNFFFGAGNSHSAIRLTGGVVQSTIRNNVFGEYYGVAHGNTGNNWEATIWGNNYTQAAVSVSIINNNFFANLDDIKLLAHSCRIIGNTFVKDNPLSATTTTLNLVCGGGNGGNMVTGNSFGNTSADMTRGNGYFFNSTDDVSGNYCLDGIYPKQGGEGNAWYVDSDNGNDSNSGRSWGQSFLTIQAASTACSSYDTIYVRGATIFSEAVTTSAAKTNVRLIGMSDSMRRPNLMSGATGSSCIVLIGRDWEIHNFMFQASANTVPLVDIQEDGTNNGSGAVINNCYFHGVGNAHSAIRLYGGAVQVKITNNHFTDFYGKTHAGYEATVWGDGYVQSAVHCIIKNNIFTDNLDSLSLQMVSCLVEGNHFTKAGYAQATTTSLNTVGFGSSGGNIVTRNTFDVAGNAVTHTNGFWGVADDVWSGNYCSDGLSSTDGTT